MKPGKLPTAWIVLLVTVILLTAAFISRAPQTEVNARRKTSPAPERVNLNSSQSGIPQPASPPPDRDSAARPSRAQEIAALQRMVDGLEAQAEEMAADNERLKAAIHNLSLQIDWSKAKKPVPADWRQRLDTMSEKVTQQRTAVKELREKTLQAARAAGAPDSVVDVDITKVLILPPGPDYSAFSKLRADLHKEARALERMELEYSEARMQIPINAPVDSI
ncbi:MAG: hypothetical protein ACO1QR_11360 [Chthoniobacteraceae bacterium]